MIIMETPPKYQIMEKIPGKENQISILKKIRDERIKLAQERANWQKMINKIENYHDTITMLEKKRKTHENEIKHLIYKKRVLKDEINDLNQDIKA